MRSSRFGLGGALVVMQILAACAAADNGASPTTTDRGLASHAVADADIEAEADAIAVDDATTDVVTPDAPPPLDGGPTDAAPMEASTTDATPDLPTTTPTPGSDGAVTAPAFDGSFGGGGKPNDAECTMAPGHAETRPTYVGIAFLFGLALVARRKRR